MEQLTVFCDGGARGNPGPAGSGCVIETSAGKRRFLCGKYLGETTNNVAEYTAVKLALETAKTHFEKGTRVDFFLDSELVVRQLNGDYRVKNPTLQEKAQEIKSLFGHFGKITFTHVPRAKNAVADSLVNKTIDLRSDFLEILES